MAQGFFLFGKHGGINVLDSQCVPIKSPITLHVFIPFVLPKVVLLIYCVSESKWYQSIFQYKLLSWGPSTVSIFFVMGYHIASQTSNITKFPWNLSEKFEAIVQNLLASKCKNYTIYIYKRRVFSTYDVLMWNMYNLHFN